MSSIRMCLFAGALAAALAACASASDQAGRATVREGSPPSSGSAPPRYAPPPGAVLRRDQVIQTANGRCSFHFDPTRHATSIECLDEDGAARAWGYDEGQSARDHGVLEADESRLYVARFSDSAPGSEVTAYALTTGEIVWHREFVGVGAHAEDGGDGNALELRLADAKLRVLGWERAGRYIEGLDAATGATLSRERIVNGAVTKDAVEPAASKVEPEPLRPGAAASVDFVFTGTSPRGSKHVSADAPGGATCSLDLDQEKDKARLSCVRGAERLWGIDLAGQFVPGAAIASGAGALYVANYCAISSGARVSAYDPSTGHLLWTRVLYAVGPVGHSQYYNDVDLRVVTDGAIATVVVSGWEAGGKYVEVLDAQTGAALGNRAVR